MHQRGLTIVTEIFPDKVAELRALLNKIGHDIKGNPHINFAGMATVHFMRWVVLGAAETTKGKIPPQLVLSTNFDGSKGAHIDEIIRVSCSGLDNIYKHCKGHPPANSPEKMKKYLLKHSLPIATLYVGAPGITAVQARKEETLRKAIGDYLLRENPSQNWIGRSAVEIRENIQNFLRSRKDMNWAFKAHTTPVLVKYGRLITLLFILGFIGFWVLLGVLLPKVALGLGAGIVITLLLTAIALRTMEERDRKKHVPYIKDADQVACLTTREDHLVQNQLSHVVEVKPGLLRRVLLMGVFHLMQFLIDRIYNRSSLAGIRSIHFARWTLIDGGRRLLFFSNFDGSWEAYLGEFVDRGAIGLGLIWSHAVDYPPTRWMFLEGARHTNDFRAWSRSHQIETQVWYSAYISLSLKNINNNNAIRKGLGGKMSEAQAREWLQLL